MANWPCAEHKKNSTGTEVPMLYLLKLFLFGDQRKISFRCARFYYARSFFYDWIQQVPMNTIKVTNLVD